MPKDIKKWKIPNSSTMRNGRSVGSIGNLEARFNRHLHKPHQNSKNWGEWDNWAEFVQPVIGRVPTDLELLDFF